MSWLALGVEEACAEEPGIPDKLSKSAAYPSVFLSRPAMMVNQPLPFPFAGRSVYGQRH